MILETLKAIAVIVIVGCVWWAACIIVCYLLPQDVGRSLDEDDGPHV